MNKPTKKFKIILISTAILIYMFSISVSAIKTATVLSFYEKVTGHDFWGNSYTVTKNQIYIDIRFLNGFTYTTSSENKTSIGDIFT